MTTPPKSKEAALKEAALKEPIRKTAALTMPSDPLSILSMQNLDRHFASQQETPPEGKEDDSTEKITQKNTEKYTESNAEENTHPHTDFNAELMAESDTAENAETHLHERPQRRKPVKQSSEVQSRPAALASKPETGISSVRQRIVEDLQREPVVRKTIDIPASLNERLQEYCAAKRIKTERRVFLVLLENFLEEEGF